MTTPGRREAVGRLTPSTPLPTMRAPLTGDLMSETRYAESHEWARLEGDTVVVGITQHAADALTDLTFLDIKVKKGDKVKKGQVFGEIDSVKATSELFAPLGGTIADV